MGKETEEMLSDMAFIIEALDGYRSGRCIDPKRVDEKINRWREIGDSLPRKWPSLKRDIDALINLTLREPEAKKLANTHILTKFCLRMVYLSLLLSFFIMIRWPNIGIIIIISAITALYILLIVRWYVMNKMFTYYEKMISSQPGKVEHIKLAVNTLIKRFKEQLGRKHIPPKKYRLHLFNTDYNDIKVLKKPGWLRDYYLCEVIVEGEECNY
jgi:uncharacterized membrane protein (DUF106 family)